MLPEVAYYHALAVRMESNYKALHRLHATHASYKEAWETLFPQEENKVSLLWEAFSKKGISLVLLGSKGYPNLLKEIPFPPLGLYIMGTWPMPALHSLAVVGTRNATHEGKQTAHAFAKALSAHHINIVSGLALGIDAASHKGTLERKGYTIAVLGNGVDDPHPRTNRTLAQEILKNGGTLLSEYPPETPPLPFRFLERNRIVSGLSEGVVVVEAPERSGSLATARFALEQNRNVFVIPGSIYSAHFKGSHALLKTGAELVTAPEDILTSLGINVDTHENPQNHDTLSPEELRIIEIIEREGKALEVDKIIELTHLNPHTVNQLLGFLSIKEKIREDGTGRYGISPHSS